MSERNFVAVARMEDVPPDAVKVVEAGGRSILLCNTNGRIFAIENQCSHAEEPLECGRIRAGWIACPAHGARFDLETGEAINPPAETAITTFAVRITGDTIEIAV